MRGHHLFRPALLCLLFAAACGANHRETGPSCQSVCTAFGFEQCHEDGTFDPPQACTADEVCDPTYGCTVCVPDQLYCGGDNAQDVWRCNSDGTGGTQEMDCPDSNVCSNGACKTPCEAAEDNPSNVGCDFWAADLDNETSMGILANDAAAQQYSLVGANNNDFPVVVHVFKNAANIGSPVQEQEILTVTIAPRTAQRMDLPQREIDGAMQQNGTYMPNSGSGTFVSPHAYHVVSTGPIVVYQFNPIIQQYSNDATTLIPRQAVGTDYVIIGYETANPCGITGLPSPDPSIPDHGAVTIIPLSNDTHVTVTSPHPIKASGGNSGITIPMTPANQPINLTLSQYMVANLESEMKTGSVFDCTNAVNSGQDGDFSGTYIKADKPVVVFTSNERGIGFGGAPNIVYPPGWDDMTDNVCCTEHFEEQLLPVTALGKAFAIGRSPIRSTDPTWTEPDIIRVVGTVDGTTVMTNAPPPFDQFTVNAREKKTFAITAGITMEASAPIEVASYLVPGQFVKPNETGDPSQVLIPAAEQHRKDYVFLVPATFTTNWAVFTRPVGSTVMVDGHSLDGVEFSNCFKAPIGTLMGVAYEQLTCPLSEGHHQASGTMPFGLTVYGYHSVGSYSFVGGSDVKIINPIL